MLGLQLFTTSAILNTLAVSCSCCCCCMGCCREARCVLARWLQTGRQPRRHTVRFTAPQKSDFPTSRPFASLETPSSRSFGSKRWNLVKHNVLSNMANRSLAILLSSVEMLLVRSGFLILSGNSHFFFFFLKVLTFVSILSPSAVLSVQQPDWMAAV